ncbi:hypothetical protein NDU88_005090 [Pleurodeles waltl]|uniref:Uncharacterized protein n=1 Tax=Pleurodeles waltl TaxID=8319 RepID=A0AAV7TBL1_PLEWA|nr:hypothetical protein NDU88_005090 [Pleurodeles waltl]
MDQVLALIQLTLISLAQKEAEDSQQGGDTPVVGEDSQADQCERPRRAGVPPKSAFPLVPKGAKKVTPKLAGTKVCPEGVTRWGAPIPNSGQEDTQLAVAIIGTGLNLGRNQFCKRAGPWGDLVSSLAKVLPWLARLGNAPQMDLASEGSALATLGG